MLDLRCLTAFSLKVATVSVKTPQYKANIDRVDQKKLSTTFSGVKPQSGASLHMFGGTVFLKDGLGNSIGKDVYNVHGSYGRLSS